MRQASGNTVEAHFAGIGRGALAAILLLCGCENIGGGAAEFSWALRTFEGDALDSDLTQACRDAGLSAVELCWRSAGVGGDFDACSDGLRRRFKCDFGHGVTRFEIPEGQTSLRIFPICEDGQPPLAETYQVPSPVLRRSQSGEVITLNSLLIVVWDRASTRSQCAPAGCTCMR
jgi:hypothetical protein